MYYSYNMETEMCQVYCSYNMETEMCQVYYYNVEIEVLLNSFFIWTIKSYSAIR